MPTMTGPSAAPFGRHSRTRDGALISAVQRVLTAYPAFKRRGGSDDMPVDPGHSDLSTLLLEGEDMIEQLAQAHTSWGLSAADHWGS
jgi:hypothetical protein